MKLRASADEWKASIHSRRDNKVALVVAEGRDLREGWVEDMVVEMGGAMIIAESLESKSLASEILSLESLASVLSGGDNASVLLKGPEFGLDVCVKSSLRQSDLRGLRADVVSVDIL